jgi:hypothetical protein
MEGLALSRKILCDGCRWMAGMCGLMPGWLVVLCSVIVSTPALAQRAEGPVVLRPGLQISPVLDTGGRCVRLAVDPRTRTLYYMNGKAQIYRVDIPPTGRAKRTLVYRHRDIGGAEQTAGMAFGPDGTLYVVSNHTLGPTTQAIIRRGVRTTSGARAWSTLASTVPYPKSNTAFDHVFNGIVVSPDGRSVYVNSGSRTDHGEIQSQGGAFPNIREVPLTATIFRIPADASDVVLPNDEAALKAQGYFFSAGVRNAYSLAFAPNGELFAGDNGPEADYTEELNWVREGQHYGFPWRLGIDANPQQFPGYDPAADRRLPPGVGAEGFYANDPSFPAPPMAFTDPLANWGPDADHYITLDGRQQDASDAGTPIYTFTPHRVPVGLTFDRERILPRPYQGDAFILSWGTSEERSRKVGDAAQDLLHLQLTNVGETYHLRATALARGFHHPIDSALLGRTLYILEWGGRGTLWALSFRDAGPPR